jgi:hypothetical protein
MVEGIRIKGGAGEFEAALIAVVLDHITREEDAVRRTPPGGGRGLPAWIRADFNDDPDVPLELVDPDRF